MEEIRDVAESLLRAQEIYLLLATNKNKLPVTVDDDIKTYRYSYRRKYIRYAGFTTVTVSLDYIYKTNKDKFLEKYELNIVATQKYIRYGLLHIYKYRARNNEGNHSEYEISLNIKNRPITLTGIKTKPILRILENIITEIKTSIGT